MDVVARLRAAGCVFAEDEAALLAHAAVDSAELEAMVARRVTGEPLEYIVGWAQFRGRRYTIETGVFVPRHRSELMVEHAIAHARPGGVLLDLCCGCGALGESVRAVVDMQLYASDIDPAAVRCARRNVQGSVHQGDLFAALPNRLRGVVDVLVVNAPYVPTEEIALLPADFREHEARAALDGGADGTQVQRRVLAEAAQWLAPGAVLVTETSPHQGELLLDVAARCGLNASVHSDEDGTATVLIARPAG